MSTRIFSALLIGCTLLAAVITACASPTSSLPTPTASTFITPGVVSPLTPQATTGALTPSAATNICTDPQVTALIDSLKTSVLTSDGALLSSLVSPANGMDVSYFHNGTVINYDQQHAKFLYETTFEVDWGIDPASGTPKTGPFHQVIVPRLATIFNQPYTLHCNELKHGGASYPVVFPYDKGFYSIYFPGTEANGNLDWNTWLVGVEHVDGKPYIYTLMQFFWEP